MYKAAILARWGQNTCLFVEYTKTCTAKGITKHRLQMLGATLFPLMRRSSFQAVLTTVGSGSSPLRSPSKGTLLV